MIYNFSVIIPTYNRVEFLKKTLLSVLEQDFEYPYEVIVVNDGSNDYTENFLFDLIKKFNLNQEKVMVKYFYQKNGGCAKARNLAIRNSSGKYLFFTDDDCIVPSNWMSTLFNKLQSYPELVGVGGWHNSSDAILSKSKFAQVFKIKQNLFYKLDNYEQVGNILSVNPSGNTANMLYKSEVFLKYGFFDEFTKLTARIDWEFKIRLTYNGEKMMYIPFFVEHIKSFDFKDFFWKSFAQGVSDRYLASKYNELGKDFEINLAGVFTQFANWKRKVNKLNFYFLSHILIRYFGNIYALIFFRFPIQKYPAFVGKTEHIRTNLISGKKDQVFLQNYKNFILSKKYLEKFKETKEELNRQDSGKTLVSVIVPVLFGDKFFSDKYLEHLNSMEIDSGKIQFIFVDNCATDQAYENFLKIKKNLKYEVKFLKTEENSGLDLIRNLGIRESSGKYILFSDVTMFFTEKNFLNFICLFKYYPELVCLGGYQQNFRPKTIFDKWMNYTTLKSYNLIFQNYSYSILPIDPSCMMIKKDNSEFQFSEDFTTLEFKDKNVFVAFIPECVSNLRSFNYQDFISIFKKKIMKDKMLISKKGIENIGLITLPDKYFILANFIKIFEFKTGVFMRFCFFYSLVYKYIYFHSLKK